MRISVPLFLLAIALAGVGCNSILGIDDHQLAPGESQGVDASTQLDAGTPQQQDGGPGSPRDSGPTGGDGAANADSADAGKGGRPGGAVAAFQCGGDSGACVLGGIFSVGRVPDDAGTGSLLDGGTVTLTDDGFEFGNTVCDTTGMTCVTGAITP
jgi:hypothetical protein